MKVMIDEVAKQAFALCDKYGINAPSHREMFVCGYRYGMRANPWHKASEELPKESGRYIVSCGDKNFITSLKYSASSRYWHTLGYQSDVKYWMQIPELPKED